MSERECNQSQRLKERSRGRYLWPAAWFFFWLCYVSIVALRLNCPVACGLLVPRQGMEPVSPALEGRFLTTGPPGEVPMAFFAGL